MKQSILSSIESNRVDLVTLTSYNLQLHVTESYSHYLSLVKASSNKFNTNYENKSSTIKCVRQQLNFSTQKTVVKMLFNLQTWYRKH